ncbi:LOW QUALITY PROTEIN: gamma-glutamyl phosphate reductase [Geomicrobium sp. JCM 19055]|nr:LOW QUALITY PROTEIN: gamma-glutamyl phosphate reductase [Geomicrobium sp. JCM 19055]
MSLTKQQATACKRASNAIANASLEKRNEVLRLIAQGLDEAKDAIHDANVKDIDDAVQNGISNELIDRLTLTPDRIESMKEGLFTLIDNRTHYEKKTNNRGHREDGLVIKNVRSPLGVIAMVYEARPNVTIDAGSLCLKAGNACLLRGSSSAKRSNEVLVTVMQDALTKASLSRDIVQLISPDSRESVNELGQLRGLVDVMIPRGSASLIQTVLRQSIVPVIETGEGNCHLYIEGTADKQMAIDIAIDSKTDRPSVCNSVETILVDREWATLHGHDLIHALIDKGVTIYGDDTLQTLNENVLPVTEEHFETEFLDYVVAMKTVNDSGEAIRHIDQYSSHHSESIVSNNEAIVERFQQLIDSAAVYHNASTRFTDGGEFGFGAEIGISTQKLHARGPLGLEALTTNKYVIQGSGQTKGVQYSHET